jgi:hypothetical protein
MGIRRSGYDQKKNHSARGTAHAAAGPSAADNERQRGNSARFAAVLGEDPPGSINEELNATLGSTYLVLLPVLL